MRRNQNHPRDDLSHTASQLAEMGFCERKMLLRQRYGPRTSLSRRAEQERGIREHARFLTEARKSNPRVASDSGKNAPTPPPTKFQRLRRLLAMIARLLAVFSAGNR